MPTPLADDAPLLVTAHLDAVSFGVLDDLRTRWFPPALNKVPAHLSLFHHLPGGKRRAVLDAIRDVCAGEARIELTPQAPRFLGRGVALAYRSDALVDVHRRLAGRFSGWLTAQDRQPFHPHVTIQNKTTPAAARELLALVQTLPPVGARVVGIDVWRYLGGPWEPVASIAFGWDA